MWSLRSLAFPIFLVTSSFQGNRHVLFIENLENRTVIGDEELFEQFDFDFVACGHNFIAREDINFFSYDVNAQRCVGYSNVEGMKSASPSIETYFINREDRPMLDFFVCKDGWEKLKNRCYKLINIDFDNKTTSNDAWTDTITNDCSRKSGIVAAQAVSIHSEEENQFLANRTLTKEDYIAGIGLIAPHNRTTFGTESFRWTDGSEIDFTRWDTDYNQPDNADGNNEFATMIFFDGVWHDFHFFKSKLLWCQYDIGSS